MVKKKTGRKLKRVTAKKAQVARYGSGLTTGFFSQFKFGESYVSLILGIFVVVFAAILVISFASNIKSKGVSPVSQQTLSQKTEKAQEEVKSPDTTKTYTVSKGENLWSISEKVYKSGYNWVDIARANNLENPGFIFSGNVLKLPDVKPVVIASAPDTSNKNIVRSETISQTASITGNTYTVQKGDFLWEIAVRAYGDGYKWVDIAKANNLNEPNLIFSENILKLPR